MACSWVWVLVPVISQKGRSCFKQVWFDNFQLQPMFPCDPEGTPGKQDRVCFSATSKQHRILGLFIFLHSKEWCTSSTVLDAGKGMGARWMSQESEVDFVLVKSMDSGFTYTPFLFLASFLFHFSSFCTGFFNARPFPHHLPKDPSSLQRSVLGLALAADNPKFSFRLCHLLTGCISFSKSLIFNSQD